MEQENCIQLSVQLLGYILIARGAGLKHKQMQRFSGFVDSLNNALPLLSWWDIFLHLWFALGHEEAKVLALTHTQQMTMLWSGSPSTSIVVVKESKVCGAQGMPLPPRQCCKTVLIEAQPLQLLSSWKKWREYMVCPNKDLSYPWDSGNPCTHTL